MPVKRIALAAVCAAALTVPAAAVAAPAKSYTPKAHARCRTGYHRRTVRVNRRIRRQGRWVIVRKRGRVVTDKQVQCVRPKPETTAHVQTVPRPATPPVPAAAAPAATFSSGPPVVEVGNIPGFIHGDASQLVQWMTAYSANAVRVILPEYRSDLDPLPAVIAADEHGYRVQLAIQWNNEDGPAQVAGYFRQILSQYGPYVWAVSIGNEQEIPFDHGPGAIALTPAQYVADWQAAEPVVAQLAPQAVRVAGDITPGALAWLQQAYAAGLPGAEAIGWHGYNGPGANTPAQVIGWAHSVNLAAWVDEGLAGPDDWPGGTVDQSAAQLAGAQLVGVWLG